jgi:hypothetical protein
MGRRRKFSKVVNGVSAWGLCCPGVRVWVRGTRNAGERGLSGMAEIASYRGDMILILKRRGESENGRPFFVRNHRRLRGRSPSQSDRRISKYANFVRQVWLIFNWRKPLKE